MEIVTGKLVTRKITVPSLEIIRAEAAYAHANGLRLVGAGPIKTVTGVKVEVIVSYGGCTCAVWRAGLWCQHRSMLAVESGQVAPRSMCGQRSPRRPQRVPKPPVRRRPRPMDGNRPLPRFRFADGSETPMDRLRARNLSLWRNKTG